jgi:hypothetical protein
MDGGRGAGDSSDGNGLLAVELGNVSGAGGSRGDIFQQGAARWNVSGGCCPARKTWRSQSTRWSNDTLRRRVFQRTNAKWQRVNIAALFFFRLSPKEL